VVGQCSRMTPEQRSLECSQMKPLRGAATGLVVLLSLLAWGCGGRPPSTVLSVRIASGVGSSGKDQRFTLRCNPTGGDMPNRAALCKLISEHRIGMLTPGQMRSTCVGGVGVPPSVTVVGTQRGRRVGFVARVMCEWPGGEAALAYWAAADMPHYLPLASLRIPCDDNLALQAAPIRWARVRSCIDKVPRHWHG
jgi:hypothetical protein